MFVDLSASEPKRRRDYGERGIIDSPGPGDRIVASS